MSDIEKDQVPTEQPVDDDVDALLTTSFKKKKVRAKKQIVLKEPESTDAVVSPDAPVAAAEPVPTFAYIELLDRVFNQINIANPPDSERQKTTLPIPSLQRAGPRKTIWTNFKQTCDILQRGPEHFMSFVCAELGSEASIDASSQLVIRGKYTSKQAESILKTYIQEYVACQICRSPNTNLTKDNVTRLHFLQCNGCGAKRSVAAISRGFHATSRNDRKAAVKKNM